MTPGSVKGCLHFDHKGITENISRRMIGKLKIKALKHAWETVCLVSLHLMASSRTPDIDRCFAIPGNSCPHLVTLDLSTTSRTPDIDRRLATTGNSRAWLPSTHSHVIDHRLATNGNSRTSSPSTLQPLQGHQTSIDVS